MNSDYFLEYTNEFKTKVAIEALEENLSICRLSKKYKLEPFLIRNWKLQFVDLINKNLKEKEFEIQRLKKLLEERTITNDL